MANRNVFLIGMMASGKSTVGRHLAKALDLDFVDSDSVIEDRAGADIPWIFDIEGEEKFRDREEKVIEELTRRQGVVVATGGGVVLREVNRRRLSERGTVVYLNAPFESLVVRAQGNSRPQLLAGEDARERLAELMPRPEWRQVVVGCLKEIEAAGRANGVNFPADIHETTLAYIEENLEDLQASLHTDVMAGRPLELETFAGAARSGT